MAHYSIIAEGNHSLSDLEAKLKEITDWDWNQHEENSVEYENGREKFHAALSVYESIRVSILNESNDPRMANKSKLAELNSLWNRFSTEKHRIAA
jgi:hypothetical protein